MHCPKPVYLTKNATSYVSVTSNISCEASPDAIAVCCLLKSPLLESVGLLEFTDALGFSIYVGRRESLLLDLQDRLHEGLKTHVLTLNSEMVVMARRIPEFNAAARSADIVVPDGIGVAFALRILRGKPATRISGIDLAEDLLNFCQNESISVFLLGARSHVVERACNNLKKMYPNLNIVGYHHGFFLGQEEMVIQKIIQSGAKFLLVGMGAPFQEFFISRTKDRLPTVFMMGVGGAFDVWSGLKRRAAGWVQKVGLEWLFRALQDYTRWRRLRFIPSFLWLILLTKLKGSSL